jgi:hypothetical protein
MPVWYLVITMPLTTLLLVVSDIGPALIFRILMSGSIADRFVHRRTRVGPLSGLEARSASRRGINGLDSVLGHFLF